MKSSDINYKLTEAMAYYDHKKYSKANPIFESLIPLLKGTKSFEGLYYRYAYSFYYMKDYLSASYHFKNFVDFFPTSPQAEEMEFMHASTLFKLSQDPELEQLSTIKAMSAMNNYLAVYPNSKRTEEGKLLMASGLSKLEEKDASAAKLYYNIGHYKAATVAYNSVMEQYPQSSKLDYYQYMIVRAWYKYAEKSIVEKQQERYNNAVAKYKEMQRDYPNSSYLGLAAAISTKADAELKLMQKN